MSVNVSVSGGQRGAALISSSVRKRVVRRARDDGEPYAEGDSPLPCLRLYAAGGMNAGAAMIGFVALHFC